MAAENQTKDPSAAREAMARRKLRASWRFVGIAAVLLVVYGFLAQDRNQEMRQRERAAEVLEGTRSGGLGARVMTPAESRRRRYRDKALQWLIPFSVLFLMGALVRRLEARDFRRGRHPDGTPMDEDEFL